MHGENNDRWSRAAQAAITAYIAEVCPGEHHPRDFIRCREEILTDLLAGIRHWLCRTGAEPEDLEDFIDSSRALFAERFADGRL